MYLHQIQAQVDQGQKARRLSWPEGHFIQRLNAGPIDITPAEMQAAGLQEEAQITIARAYLYVSSSTSATLAYELTSDDKTYQDWVLID